MKHPVYPHRVVDLALHQVNEGGSTYAIRQVLTPDAFGIDIRTELSPFQQARSKQLVS